MPKSLKQSSDLISPRSSADLTGASKNSLTSQCACESLPVNNPLILHATSEAPKLGNSLAGITFEISAAEVQAVQHLVAQVIANDLLSSDVMKSLRAALDEKYVFPFVLGYTQTHVVFETFHEATQAWKLFRQEFDANSDGEITFKSDPEEVRLVSRIIPVSADSGGDMNVLLNTNLSTEAIMPKVQTTETDVDPNKDPVTSDSATTPAVPATETPTTPAPKDETVPAVQNSVTVQQYIAAAPQGMQDVLNSALRMHETRKAEVITQLTKTGRCKFDDAFLKAQSLEMLENLLELAAVPNYSGRATPEPTVQQDNTVPAAPKVFALKSQAAN